MFVVTNITFILMITIMIHREWGFGSFCPHTLLNCGVCSFPTRSNIPPVIIGYITEYGDGGRDPHILDNASSWGSGQGFFGTH
jgi:hypothetical protein